eukprot:78017-Rhodomonas_salina.6
MARPSRTVTAVVPSSGWQHPHCSAPVTLESCPFLVPSRAPRVRATRITRRWNVDARVRTGHCTAISIAHSQQCALHRETGS